MEPIPYPSNYFDPEPDDEPAQCEICGGWYEQGDMHTVEQVLRLRKFDTILQGVCAECADAENTKGKP